jgi:hypothetical protein
MSYEVAFSDPKPHLGGRMEASIMYRFATASFLGWLCLTAIAAADHIEVSGNVSGTWSADTVFVTGDIEIPPLGTLVIDPGTVVLFNDHYKFEVSVSAALEAVGTESDTIKFDEATEGTGWHGIRFIGTSDLSLLEYCHISNGMAVGADDDAYGGGIYILAACPTIRNCVIESCSADKGAGIYCAGNSGATIEGSVVCGNNAAVDGGAVYLYWCYAEIYNCTLCDNTASGQGGVYCQDSYLGMAHSIVFFNDTQTGLQITLDGTTLGFVECCDIEGGWSGPNFSKAPEFCDRASGDYHLTDCSDLLPENNACAALIGALGAGCVCTGVERTEAELPAGYAVRQNYPNPFNPVTAIEFTLPRRTAVNISVYDLLGRRVAVLVDRTVDAGDHRVAWDGRDAASGMYVYRFTAGDTVISKKMMLLK